MKSCQQAREPYRLSPLAALSWAGIEQVLISNAPFHRTLADGFAATPLWRLEGAALSGLTIVELHHLKTAPDVRPVEPLSPLASSTPAKSVLPVEDRPLCEAAALLLFWNQGAPAQLHDGSRLSPVEVRGRGQPPPLHCHLSRSVRCLRWLSSEGLFPAPRSRIRATEPAVRGSGSSTIVTSNGSAARCRSSLAPKINAQRRE